MAQNFKNFLTRNIGTSAVAINDATNTFDTLIGIRLCNVAASQILMDVILLGHLLIIIWRSMSQSLRVDNTKLWMVEQRLF